VPVLARSFETAGMSTILVTMMPYWSERIGVPRTVGLEFPYSHTLGHAGERDEQMAVIRDALRVLRDASEPGTIEHLPYEWPDFPPGADWRREWYPETLPPIVRWLRAQAEARRAAHPEGE
jgi:hypothetical protein